MLGGDVRNQNLPNLVICGQVAYNIESCPYLASGMVNKTPTGHLLPAPPANYEIFETSSKYILLYSYLADFLSYCHPKAEKARFPQNGPFST